MLAISFGSESAVGGPVYAAGLVDILTNMFDSAYTLVVLGIILLAVVFVAMTWIRTRSMVPTLGALLLGALVAIAVSNFTWLSNRIGQDAEDFNREGNSNNIGNEDLDNLDR